MENGETSVPADQREGERGGDISRGEENEVLVSRAPASRSRSRSVGGPVIGGIGAGEGDFPVHFGFRVVSHRRNEVEFERFRHCPTHVLEKIRRRDAALAGD